MTPQQELTLKNIVIGALRGCIVSLQNQANELQPRATASYRTVLDTRTIPALRNIAKVNGLDPEWAESRYWRCVDHGYSEQLAFDEVVAEFGA